MEVASFYTGELEATAVCVGLPRSCGNSSAEEESLSDLSCDPQSFVCFHHEIILPIAVIDTALDKTQWNYPRD